MANFEGDLILPITHNCGREFEVSIAGKDLQTFQYKCPGCGAVDGFDDEQIANIVAQYEAAKAALKKQFPNLR